MNWTVQGTWESLETWAGYNPHAAGWAPWAQGSCASVWMICLERREHCESCRRQGQCLLKFSAITCDYGLMSSHWMEALPPWLGPSHHPSPALPSPSPAWLQPHSSGGWPYSWLSRLSLHSSSRLAFCSCPIPCFPYGGFERSPGGWLHWQALPEFQRLSGQLKRRSFCAWD